MSEIYEGKFRGRVEKTTAPTEGRAVSNLAHRFSNIFTDAMLDEIYDEIQVKLYVPESRIRYPVYEEDPQLVLL